MVAEALADTRRRHEERLHNNQPEWMRGTRRVQPEAMVQQELEAPLDVRCWDDERQRDNQLNKRHKKGAVRGGGAMRGGGTEGWEEAA